MVEAVYLAEVRTVDDHGGTPGLSVGRFDFQVEFDFVHIAGSRLSCAGAGRRAVLEALWS
ncbi:hypothetical protein [Micromonospora sp. NPDC005161]